MKEFMDYLEIAVLIVESLLFVIFVVCLFLRKFISALLVACLMFVTLLLYSLVLMLTGVDEDEWNMYQQAW